MAWHAPPAHAHPLLTPQPAPLLCTALTVKTLMPRPLGRGAQYPTRRRGARPAAKQLKQQQMLPQIRGTLLLWASIISWSGAQKAPRVPTC